MSQISTDGPATITIRGRRRPVRHAHFGITVIAEDGQGEDAAPAPASVCYWLNVDVDEHSGDDGAPQPVAEDIPVPRAAGGRHPSLAALGALTVEELNDGYDWEDWDAWFGNDAPPFYENVVRFQGWSGPMLNVQWTARYRDPGPKPFAFEGPVEFTGIYVNVAEDEDPDDVLARVWGGQPPSTFDRHELPRRAPLPNVPPERRVRVGYVYMPKGTPLSSRWVPAAPSAPPPPPPVPAGPKVIGPVAAGPLVDPREVFALDMPEGWESLEDSALQPIGGMSLRESAASASALKAVAVALFPGFTLASYVETSVGAYSAIWTVEERRKVSCGGAPGVRLVIRQKIEASDTRLLKYFVASPRKLVDGRRTAVVLTFAAAPDAFAERLPVFEAMMSSLRLLEEPKPAPARRRARRSARRG